MECSLNQETLKNKPGVVIIVDYSRDYTVVMVFSIFFNSFPF